MASKKNTVEKKSTAKKPTIKEGKPPEKTPTIKEGKPAEKKSKAKNEIAPKKSSGKEKPTNGVATHKNGTPARNKGVRAEEVKQTAKTSGEDSPQLVKKAAKKPAPKKTAASKSSKNVSLSVEFRLRFHTKFGQTLHIVGDHELLGNMDVEQAMPLEYLDTNHWRLALDFPADIKQPINYYYILKQSDGNVTYDWGVKSFDPSLFRSRQVLVVDAWNHAGYFENAFYTEPFRDILLAKTSHTGDSKASKNFTHRFTVKAPLLREGEAVCILGAQSGLANWNTAAPILMNKKADEDNWTVQVDLSKHNYIVEYKYGVYDVNADRFVRYESGDNRFVQAAATGQQVNVNDSFVVLPNDTWKGAGIAIPVFSLRSERSFGVGEFTDIKLLVDWAKQTGFQLVQILPVNDTSATHSWKDSYPYAAISAFALHPMFLNLEHATDEKNKHLLQRIESTRKELNAATAVEYEAVNKAKWDYIRQIFPLQKAATFKKQDFKDFFKANEHWLVPYAVFCYLRDKYGTADFNQWPAYSKFNEQEIAALASDVSHDDINIHFFVQYHLHLQLKAATQYAHENHVIVKGDIPIGVYRYGADAWQQPELYHLDVQAGAPPDDFAVKGQNWGFPTYNWERMRQDGFRWWKQRFEQMSYYFDAFRIDHILGFFRIWSIPLHAVEGIMGRFVPAVPVHVNEFNERGIRFEYLRYCRPYITDAVLQEVFGDRSQEVKDTFLQYDGFEHYVLKDEFDTQRKVQQYFEGREDQSLKEGLFDLISNVILFEEEDAPGTKFHFRFGIEDTLSFKHLDPHTQYQLKQLYVNYFFERQDHHWEVEAMQKLPGLKRATNMLVCGEDLGLVPHCVPHVMQQLGILSLEIQRMPKAVRRQFFNPAEAPYLSVVTPSTHDMSTVRGWWEEDRSITQQFYNNELRQPGEAPHYCEPWINKAIILQHLYSPAMWSIFQLQDLLGMSSELRREDPSEERINLPSNPQHYWNYRMHINMENLVGAREFNDELRDYLTSSGRI